MKVDFKKELKALYAPSAKDFQIVEVPKMNFLMIDGSGNPNVSPEYVDAIEALYSVSYTLKFTSKKNLEKDYVVPPLEGLWWADDMDAFTQGKKEDWKWTMMIMVPEWLSKSHVEQAIEAVKAKNSKTRVERLRFEAYHEGLSVQIMHVGPYDAEAPTLLKLHKEWIPQNGFTETLHHHEIYISDPRKTDPSKLKTVLRQPVRKI